MQIILSILQFIGIALLVLLGILVVLILLILFYPICYTIEGELYSQKTVKARVSWLFHLIRAKALYEDDVISAKIGIFWKNIPFSYEFASKQTEDNEKAHADIEIEADKGECSKENTEGSMKSDSSENHTDSDSASEVSENVSDEQKLTESNNVSQDVLKESLESLESPSISEEKSESDTDINDIFETDNDRDTSEAKVVESDAGIDDVLKIRSETDASSITETEHINSESDFDTDDDDENVEFDESGSENESNASGKEKISLIDKIKGMISKIKGTINKMKQVWCEIKAMITDERNKSAVGHIKDEIISLLKSFLPVKSKINGVFSTGSPDTTGQVFGVIAAFPFMYQNEWSLRPDFTAEAAYFEGSFYAKGRIYLYKIVGMVLRILLDKNCRRLYMMIKQFQCRRG